MTDEYVLLWSQSQNAFHLERLEDMLKANRQAFTQDRRMDYVPIHFGTYDECSDIADVKRSALIEREGPRLQQQEMVERARRVAL